MRNKKFLQKVEDIFNLMCCKPKKLYELKNLINETTQNMFTDVFKRLEEEKSEITNCLNNQRKLLLDNRIDSSEYKKEHAKLFKRANIE
ncbi:hypothetical protein [Rickettsia helvetica]|uniref:Uncharacterized protein n=1 Tax=Rickettsia helvetica TaxID=35789 RepID=A0ABM9NAS4_RICHE|nr:hypothetical protein [Rickettsia helvetica]